MKIKMHVMAIIVLVVIFGGIAAAKSVDIWATTSSKIPAKYKTGDFAGTYNPADIRGSYTFQDVADAFQVDLLVLYEAFGIAENTDGTQIQTKDLETLYNIDTPIGNESVQVFVALYKNLPIILGDVYLPKPAVNILLEANQNLTQVQKNYLKDHQVEIIKTGLTDSGTNDSEVNNKPAQEQLVKGSTTFQQVLDAGITSDQIQAIIGAELPPTHQTVKDYCIQKGLSFPTIKNQLNELAE